MLLELALLLQVLPGIADKPAATQAAGGGGVPTPTHAWKNSDNASGSVAVTTTGATAGRALIVFIGTADNSPPNGSASSVSDNIDGTTGWVRCIGKTNDLGAGLGYSMLGSMFVKFNIPSGVTTVTCTHGSFFITAIIHEQPGVTTFTSSETAGSTHTSSANPQTGTQSNGTANSIYYAGVDGDGGPGPQSYTINQTGTTGTFVLYDATNSQETNAGSEGHTIANVVYQIVSSSSARGHGWTVISENGTQMEIILH